MWSELFPRPSTKARRACVAASPDSESELRSRFQTIRFNFSRSFEGRCLTALQKRL